MNDINYDKELRKITGSLATRPKLMLHSCCAPCSSYCLIYLLPYFDITCLYYNPNITEKDEYDKRVAELVRLADMLNEEYDPSKKGWGNISVIEGDYEPEKFIDAVRSEGLEECPEGGRRCGMCFTMRLQKTYELAADNGFDYFTTTLTISPLKNAKVINDIGYSIAEGGKVMWLPSDFKKNDGYKRSVELSAKYELYRQNYCGCWLSRRDVAAGGAPSERER